MTDWKALLSELSETVMSMESFDETMLQFYGVPELTDSDRESKWLGFPPASDSEIAETEARLGHELPQSLRDFYLVSNGWRQISDFVYEIVPVQKLNWIREVDPEFCEIVEDSFDLPDLEDSREENEVAVLRSVCLAQKGDATTLLIDPENRTEDGEWVVGAWASWHPGIDWSGVGFAGFMEQTLEECRTLLSETEGEQDVDLNT
jgi:hypothetical protein